MLEDLKLAPEKIERAKALFTPEITAQLTSMGFPKMLESAKRSL